MPSARTSAVALLCHSSSPCEAVRSLTVRVDERDPGFLRLEYALDADLTRLRVPALRSPRRTDGLWRRTCFEAFVAGEGGPEYCELNFSPSTEWAVYRFDAYREGMSPVEGIEAPRITVHRSDGGLRLDVSVSLDCAPAKRSAVRRLALAAVIEDENGRLSYWALKHPADRPDFHHPDGFVLELQA